ncbi:hypothetical protein FPRO04_13456 [Fusarium proliferatum]|nr:hypothetical protein FPRO04_13456 [Fusarium proliferatum]
MQNIHICGLSSLRTSEDPFMGFKSGLETSPVTALEFGCHCRASIEQDHESPLHQDPRALSGLASFDGTQNMQHRMDNLGHLIAKGGSIEEAILALKRSAPSVKSCRKSSNLGGFRVTQGSRLTTALSIKANPRIGASRVLSDNRRTMVKQRPLLTSLTSQTREDLHMSLLEDGLWHRAVEGHKTRPVHLKPVYQSTKVTVKLIIDPKNRGRIQLEQSDDDQPSSGYEPVTNLGSDRSPNSAIFQVP